MVTYLTAKVSVERSNEYSFIELLTYSINGKCISQNERNGIFFGLMNCEKFDACELKSNFVEHLVYKLRATPTALCWKIN
jgi:hypothetical protein